MISLTSGVPPQAGSATTSPAGGDGAGIDQTRVRVLPDGRLTRRDAARYLGYQPKTLAMWHTQGKGPRCVRIGGRCFYYIQELNVYIRDESAAA